MKIAVALNTRKALRTSLEDLENRASAAAYDPKADPSAEASLKVMFSAAEREIEISIAIERTNHATIIDVDGVKMSLSDIKTLRDALVRQHAELRSLTRMDSSSTVHGGYVEVEGKIQKLPDVKIPIQWDRTILAARLDQMAKRARELDVKLQEANWTFELL